MEVDEDRGGRRLNELCKGCCRNQYYACFFRRYGKQYKCPCIECLVKVVCIDECEIREYKRRTSLHVINEKLKIRT